MTARSKHRQQVAQAFKGSAWLRELTASLSHLHGPQRDLLSAVIRDCQQYRESRRLQRQSPIRLIHHFACTGGTLISRAVQAQPNTLVLSEVDPFSTIPRDYKHSRFAPSDVILLARSGHYDIDNETIEGVFIESLRTLYEKLERSGRHLIVRSHSHSQFCTNVPWTARPTVQQVIDRHFRTISVVTVRHPIDSWLSLNNNGWRHFDCFCLEEYCKRYLVFLDCHREFTRWKYEQFVSEPNETMRKLCEELELTYNDDWQHFLSILRLSGDSGRSGARISFRDRRKIPKAVVEEALASPAYQEVCNLLGYEPNLHGSNTDDL